MQLVIFNLFFCCCCQLAWKHLFPSENGSTYRCTPQYVHINKIIRCCEPFISLGYPQTFQLKDKCPWASFTDLKFCCSPNGDNSFLRRDDHSRDRMNVSYLKKTPLQIKNLVFDCCQVTSTTFLMQIPFCDKMSK